MMIYKLCLDSLAMPLEPFLCHEQQGECRVDRNFAGEQDHDAGEDEFHLQQLS